MLRQTKKSLTINDNFKFFKPIFQNRRSKKSATGQIFYIDRYINPFISRTKIFDKISTHLTLYVFMLYDCAKFLKNHIKYVYILFCFGVSCISLILLIAFLLKKMSYHINTIHITFTLHFLLYLVTSHEPGHD